MKTYHVPVMIEECIEALALKKGGIYVDATLGGGGHSLAMLNACPEIILYAFDQDLDAIQYADKVLSAYTENVNLIHTNFEHIRTELAMRRIAGIDGILYDLGLSSHQIDEASRGFSFDKKAALDMRMNREQDKNAFAVVNELSMRELAIMIKDYSDELHANRIARAIESARAIKPIETTTELSSIIERAIGHSGPELVKSKARVFQAIRIYVNDELDILQKSLTDSIHLLNPGGRVVVMSYHSLEDRIVKNTFKEAAKGCVCPPNLPQCVCDKQKILKILNSRPVEATNKELETNTRSRSAKLRVAEKLRGKR